MPNYVYQCGTPAPSRFMAMASRLMGRARRRLNTPSRLFKNSGRKSGRDFWQRPDHFDAVGECREYGRDVDGIRTTVGANTPDNPVFIIITGDRTKIYVDGQDGGRHINAGYNHWARLTGSANIYVGDFICISKQQVASGRELQPTPCGMRHVPKNTIVVGKIVHILLLLTGDSPEGRTGQSVVR